MPSFRLWQRRRESASPADELGVDQAVDLMNLGSAATDFPAAFARARKLASTVFAKGSHPLGADHGLGG